MRSDMACDECGESIYSTWNYCPHCGHTLDLTQAYVDEAIRVGGEDHRPNKEEFNEQSDLNSGTAARLFGSWNQLLKEAGYTPPSQGRGERPSKEQVIEDMQDLRDELGKAPRKQDVVEHLDYGTATVKSVLEAEPRDPGGPWYDVLFKCKIYRCPTCYKEFETPQGLTGHMSKHTGGNVQKG